ncbi:MAG TPA: aldehyde dehydrogenase family protein [Saprospiraceae bacterium]|nr:aldehyde dehydrogenase family protein [Saprospiraceae bacterium]
MQDIFQAQQRHRLTVARTTAAERIAKLQRLHDTMLRYRDDIKAALWQDFRKNGFETDISELGVVNGEIRHAIRYLRSWMAVQPVGTPLVLLGTSSEIRYEAKGVCLILSPWNFPFNLTLSPLVAAVAAGNCVIVKPSEYAPASAALMKKIVEACFPPEEVALLEGGVALAQALLELPFNHVFFTGSPTVGKLVMAAAARQLSSVTLELGGKNPVVVDETADLDVAAEKIAWTRTMNAGQSCISPDYVLVHESVHDALVQKIRQRLDRFYGSDPEARQASPDYCRIINARSFGRIKGWLDDAVQQGAQVAYGGRTDEASCYIEPTVLTHIPEGAAIWNEEVFGPVLSVRAYSDLSAALAFIRSKPVPLAAYIFSARQRNIRQFLAESQSGNVTVNDCEVHFYNPQLPFGGLNNSGIGRAHGHFAFLEFSHARGVCRQNRWKPLTDLFHPPYGKKWLQKLLAEAVVKWF